MKSLPHIFELTPDSLRELAGQWGLPAYRAVQLLQWVYEKKVIDPQLMTNLSNSDRELIGRSLGFLTGGVVEHQTATDGVQKLLVDWSAGEGVMPVLGRADRQTECVMIPTDGRRTACISSQVGCAVGCKFCASGLGGLDGNLTTGQIVEQVWRLGALGGVERISHVVFMGMGEPLANFEQVTGAIRILMADWAMGISGRRITVSTVGVPASIRRLADLRLPITLAISLHAPDDQLRRRLIPWAQYVTIEQLIEMGRYYFDKTKREVTLEYILLGGVNDGVDHARQLVQVARKLRSNVNLIRYNEVKGLAFDRPATEGVHRFAEVLKQAGVNCHIRASRGRDIAAACGQLRHEHVGGEVK